LPHFAKLLTDPLEPIATNPIPEQSAASFKKLYAEIRELIKALDRNDAPLPKEK
jgi:hypothetical protein